MSTPLHEPNEIPGDPRPAIGPEDFDDPVDSATLLRPNPPFPGDEAD